MTARFPFTTIAFALATIVVVAALVGDVDVVKLDVAFFQRIEPHEIDDIVVALGLVVVALIADTTIARRRARRQAAIAAARLRVLKATMRTVQDTVNNFLNNMLLFRIEAERAFSSESLERFDRLVETTTAKLKVLGDLESIPEAQTSGGITIDYDAPPPPAPMARSA